MPRLIVHGFTISLVPRRFLLGMAVLVYGTLAQAQIDSAYIVLIDRYVHEVDAGKDYAVKTLENEEFLTQMTDGWGELTGMMRDGALVKVVKWIGLSSCTETMEYYFQDWQLVFVSAQGAEFAYVDSTASFDPGVQKVTMEGRFYYRDGVAAPVVLKGSTRCGGAPTKEWAAMYPVELARLKDLLMR